jgi:hypothetical protein
VVPYLNSQKEGFYSDSLCITERYAVRAYVLPRDTTIHTVSHRCEPSRLLEVDLRPARSRDMNMTDATKKTYRLNEAFARGVQFEPSGQRSYWDDRHQGLGLRVGTSTMTWIVRPAVRHHILEFRARVLATAAAGLSAEFESHTDPRHALRRIVEPHRR